MAKPVLTAVRTMFSLLPVFIGVVSLGPAAAGAQEPAGVVRGIVRDSLGAPVPFAQVSVVGTDRMATADVTGHFRITEVPFGTLELRVRRLGYRPLAATLVLPRGSDAEIELRIFPSTERLPDVEVVEKKEVFDARLRGFKERSTKGVGHFITRERLENLHSYRFTDILREIPGVRLRMMRGGGMTVNLRGSNCSPVVFVDGFPATAGVVDLDMFDLAGVEGIEVYPGLSSIPPAFVTGQGLERCGVIAIWSRPYRPAPRAVVRKESRSGALDSLVASMTVFTKDEVDTPAVLVDGSAVPVYPDSLRAAGVDGKVVVQLIVNADGSLDPESVALVSSTDPLFTASVEEAMGGARFRAAILNSRPVRQVMRLPFVFRLEKEASRR